jgi:hypothetical protein
VLKKASELDPAKITDLSSAESKLKDEQARLDAAKGNLDKIFPPPDNLSVLMKLHADATAVIATATTSLGEANTLVTAIRSAADTAKAAAVVSATSKIDDAVVLVGNVTPAVNALVDGVGEAEKSTPTKDNVIQRAKELIDLTRQSFTKLNEIVGKTKKAQSWFEWFADLATTNTNRSILATPMTTFLTKLTSIFSTKSFTSDQVNEITNDVIAKVVDTLKFYKIKYNFLPEFKESAKSSASAPAPAPLTSETPESELKEIDLSLYILTQIIKVIDKVVDISTKMVNTPSTDVSADVKTAVKELTDVNKPELAGKLPDINVQLGGGNTDDESIDSHSNSHSANNKTKNKNNSKSKSKNKTKKNHSKSKSNKSKTPKIIMNE